MKRVLITGTNRGIGLELSRQFKEKSYHVTALCREASEDLKNLDVNIVEGVDLASDANLQKTAEHLEGPFDIIMQNAGILHTETLEDFNTKSIAEQFRINSIAPLYFANLLVGKLNQGAKIFFTSSRMGSIADNSSGGYYGYRMSKAALNAGAKSLAIDLKAKGIAVGILHPGFVKTRMTGFNGDLRPEQSAKGLIEQVEKLTLEQSGSFIHANGEALVW